MSDRPTVHVYMLDCLWNTTVLISVTNCIFMPIQCAIQRKFTCDVHVKFEWGFDLKIVWIFRACSGWLSSVDRSLDSRSAMVIPTPAELTTAAEHRVRILFLLQVLGGSPIVDAITAFFQCDHLECSLNSFLFPMAFPAATHTLPSTAWWTTGFLGIIASRRSKTCGSLWWTSRFSGLCRCRHPRGYKIALISVRMWTTPLLMKRFPFSCATSP